MGVGVRAIATLFANRAADAGCHTAHRALWRNLQHGEGVPDDRLPSLRP